MTRYSRVGRPKSRMTNEKPEKPDAKKKEKKVKPKEGRDTRGGDAGGNPSDSGGS